MAEQHHHHLFHHHKDEEKPVDAVAYSETTYGSDGMGGYSESTTVAAVAVDYEKEEKQHKTREHLGELGAIAAGAFALVNTTGSFFPRLLVIVYCDWFKNRKWIISRPKQS